MIARTPWLERHFETELALEMFPNLLERLRGTPARVEDRLRGVALETLVATHGDSWSILDNAGHLLQVEALWAARLDDFEAGRTELTPARFESWRVGEAQFNQRAARDLCAGFRVAVEKACVHYQLLAVSGWSGPRADKRLARGALLLPSPSSDRHPERAGRSKGSRLENGPDTACRR